MSPQLDASFGAAVIGNQGGHRQAFDLQSLHGHGFGVHKLRHDPSGYIRSDFDFGHPCSSFCTDPSQLGLGWHENGVDLKAVAQPYFADINIDFLHGILLIE